MLFLMMGPLAKLKGAISSAGKACSQGVFHSTQYLRWNLEGVRECLAHRVQLATAKATCCPCLGGESADTERPKVSLLSPCLVLSTLDKIRMGFLQDEKRKKEKEKLLKTEANAAASAAHATQAVSAVHTARPRRAAPPGAAAAATCTCSRLGEQAASHEEHESLLADTSGEESPARASACL